MESGVESTVCVLVVVIVVKWVFSLLGTSRVSQLGQQFISQQGGREGGEAGKQCQGGSCLPTHHWLLTYLTTVNSRNASQFAVLFQV